MTDRATEFAGTVIDANGAPVAGAYVAVFAVDPIYRAEGSRRAPPLARSATDGTFTFTRLPPGAYYAIARAEISAPDLLDEAVVAGLIRNAVIVTLADGEKKVHRLRLASGQ